MKVLETKAALDAIWWEHDGKTVALDVERLKRGPVLQDLFGGIQYKFFIRNFSR